MASLNAKDFGKKKRANRSAKLKQCKLDARREQWLSQVKGKGRCDEEANAGGRANAGPLINLENHIKKLEIKPNRSVDTIEHVILLDHYCDSESFPSSSPTSSILGSHDSGTNFSRSGRTSSSISSSSNGCCSASMTDEEEEDNDECLDDWEAIADADHKSQEGKTKSGSDLAPLNKYVKVDQVSSADISKPKPEREAGNCRAWRLDDVCRPQCLPNISKPAIWGFKNVKPVQISCPICCEDLDYTDQRFFPCPCGFRLCLFCHKRILEEDGRCPGCRKQYDRDCLQLGV